MADRINDYFIPIAKQIVIEGGQHRPTFFIHDATKDELVVGEGYFDSFDAKLNMLESVKGVLDEYQSKFYYVIIEGWFVEYPSPEDLKIPPSEHPNRKECLSSTFAHRSGFVKHWTYKFHRTGEGVVFEEPMVSNEAESRFLLFDRKDLYEEDV